MTANTATKTVKSIKQKHSFNDRQMAEMLTISRVTYYKRLQNNDWKPTEIALIKNLKTTWL